MFNKKLSHWIPSVSLTGCPSAEEASEHVTETMCSMPIEYAKKCSISKNKKKKNNVPKHFKSVPNGVFSNVLSGTLILTCTFNSMVLHLQRNQLIQGRLRYII